LVTTGRHHWPGASATCSKHVDDDDADDDHEDVNDGDGDGDDELTLHSSTVCAFMSAHFAFYTCQVGQQTGQQHWAAPLASTAGQGSADTDWPRNWSIARWTLPALTVHKLFTDKLTKEAQF
jgi:hypothetical protein